MTEWGGFGSVQIPDDGNTYSITVNGSYLVTPSRDAVPPAVTLSPDRAPDSNGYYNYPVAFTITGDDSTTGNSNSVTCDAPITYSGPDGSAISVSASCQDGAGNVGHGSVTIAYDATLPMISAITGSITNGASYIVGTVPANNMSCSATDAISGLDGACAVTGYSTAVGPHTLTATAKDRAGNTATR